MQDPNQASLPTEESTKTRIFFQKINWLSVLYVLIAMLFSGLIFGCVGYFMGINKATNTVVQYNRINSYLPKSSVTPKIKLTQALTQAIISPSPSMASEVSPSPNIDTTPFLKALQAYDPVDNITSVSPLKIKNNLAEMKVWFHGGETGALAWLYNSNGEWNAIYVTNGTFPVACSIFIKENIPQQYWLDCYQDPNNPDDSSQGSAWMNF